MTRSSAFLILTLGVISALAVGTLSLTLPAQDKPDPRASVAPKLKCADQAASDQDDMAVWLHPTDPGQSTIIASDKAADKLFVYDLAGKTLQTIATKHPGNIDVRYGFPLGKEKVDIVAFNQRTGYQIMVYRVDPATRRLERIDDNSITTGECYGGTLYVSPRTGKFFFFTTGKKNGMEQYELFEDGAGKVKGKKVRAWPLGYSEAAVGDDETGKIYIGEEQKGVWEVGGEPDDPAPGKLVIKLGEHGLAGDVEGLAIYYLPGGKGYLLVSNQGKDNFKVYRREGDHAFLGTFAIQGARDSDGLDVTNANLGPAFPHGFFACHTASGNCPILVTPWEAIAKAMKPELMIDTTWKRRK
jgi:3-phytase